MVVLVGIIAEKKAQKIHDEYQAWFWDEEFKIVLKALSTITLRQSNLNPYLEVYRTLLYSNICLSMQDTVKTIIKIMFIIIITRELSIICYYHIIVTIIINHLYGLIMDPYSNQFSVGLIAQRVDL